MEQSPQFRPDPVRWHSSALVAARQARPVVTDAVRLFVQSVGVPGLVATVRGLPDPKDAQDTAYRITVHVDDGVDEPLADVVASVTFRPKGTDAVKCVVRLGETNHESKLVPTDRATQYVWDAMCRAVAGSPRHVRTLVDGPLVAR